MILDWHCPCGLSGIVVVLKADEPIWLLRLSQAAHEITRLRSEQWHQNRCDGNRVKYSIQAVSAENPQD